MSLRLFKGELGLALFFAAVGALWILRAARMPLWEGFAPDTGFLPLIYGVLLTGLAAAVFVQLLLEGPPPARDSVRKPLLVAAALAVAVAALPYAGFVVSVFALLLFLYAVIEKLPWLSSVLAAAGTTGGLYLVFKVWLSVPLP